MIGLPFIIDALAEPPDEPPVLIVELQGAVSDVQAEQKVQQDTKGAAQQPEQPAPSPAQATADQPAPADQPPQADDAQPPQAAPSPATPDTPPATQSTAGTNNVTGTTEKQAAQTIKTESPTEAELLREYAKQLSKKVRANLVNPGRGHASSATVSFFILSDGHIRPDSLKIVASSGQYKVDASALQTIRASVPFAPPPREMSVRIVVDFNHKG